MRAPGRPGRCRARKGRHWYYRIDRVTHRKCWFTHAITSLAAHPAAEFLTASSIAAPPVAAPQSPSAAMPTATPTPMPGRGVSTRQAPADAANSSSEATGTPPAPHVTVLAVKPDPAFTGTISQSVSPSVPSSLANAPEPGTEPQTPQIPAGHADIPRRGDSLRASRASPVAATVATAATPERLAPANSAATAAAPAPSAESFPVWALAFVVAAALTVLFGRMTGLLHLPSFAQHPDDAWRRGFYERDSPFLVPREPDGPTDLNLLRRIERSPPVQASHPDPAPRWKGRTVATG